MAVAVDPNWVCASCGKPVEFEALDGEVRWAKVPCDCGSNLFKMKVGETKWKGVYGTNG